MSPGVRKPLLGAAGLAGGILCWALVQWLFSLPPHILPSPWQVVVALGSGFAAIGDADENWVLLAASSFTAGLAGWIAGGLAGIAAAALLAGRRRVEELLTPWLALPGGLAGAAAAPLVLYWGGFGTGAKILLAAWLTFFPVARAGLARLRAVPPHWQDVMRGFSASSWETFTRLSLPVALPGVFGAWRRAWTPALTGVVIAELLGAPVGLGAQIFRHAAVFDLAGAIAGLAVFAAIGSLIASLLRSVERLVIEWISPSPHA